MTSQRIAHWIKHVLSEAGVDTRVFKAHSARGASVSAAKSKGVGIPDILEMVDWSRDTTSGSFITAGLHPIKISSNLRMES